MALAQTVIITSAGYLDPQLEAEFGRIPPAFLPLGSQRLYEHQHHFVQSLQARVILSVPEDFVLSKPDTLKLAELNIEVLPVPLGLSLGESLIYTINVSACAVGCVAVLHGDTLLEGLDLEKQDAISVGVDLPGYRWGQIVRQGDWLIRGEPSRGVANEETAAVLTGWFSFSDGSVLVQSVTRQGGDFLKGLFAYACKRAITTQEATHWFDFGHADTYYQSRRRVTTQRSFNELKISKRSVTKSSLNPAKMAAEANWFEELPSNLRIHAPALLQVNRDDQQVSYSLEYLHLPTLTELFVFGRLQQSSWESIFDACDEALTGMAAHSAPEQTANGVNALYGTKTFERLNAHAAATQLDMTAPCRFGGAWLPSIERMATLATTAIPPAAASHLTLVHGDFCFSNLLYDHRADLIRMIDPRGLDASGQLSCFGDRRYDIAKLHHSVIGRYDHIIAGHYRLEQNGPLDFNLLLPTEPDITAVEHAFRGRQWGGLSIDEAAAPAICVLLFLSMLPLHADHPARQNAFLANAMRLFVMLDGIPTQRLSI